MLVVAKLNGQMGGESGKLTSKLFSSERSLKSIVNIHSFSFYDE